MASNGQMTLRMVLKLAANDFTRGISAIQKQIQGLGSYMKTAFAVGSVVSFSREMVKWTRDFEDSMARAKAVSNAPAEGFRMMRDEALRLGASTRYTSVEVAQTLEVLTRNGLSATNATRALADVLKLAQANAIDLADAGNILTNVSNMFGLSIGKAAYVTDILSATASSSATDLTSLYEAMTNAAPMAHALGIDIEEVASALGALANVGVKGPDAGTQLRQFLQRLTDPLAMKKMQKLTGFSFDEDFIRTEGLEGVLKKLQSLNLSVSQLNEIFTVRSSKSIIQLMNSMDNFVSLLGTMENAAGTASRMFVEGVGSMRYELDILRSMWQNWMIQIGNSTEGPFLSIVKVIQGIIITLQNWGTALLQLIPLFMVFHRRIYNGFTDLLYAVDAWAKKNVIANQLAIAQQKKYALQQKLTNKQLDSAQKSLIANSIKYQTQLINGYKAQQKAANALKATIASIGWAAAIIGVELLITKLVSLNAEIRQAKKSVEESDKAADNLRSKVNMLRDMIGKGSDTDSLNGAVNEAKKMFSEFSDAINQAYIEAGKTGNYEKLKDLLTDISELQIKISASKSNQELVDATMDKYASTLFRQRYNRGSVPWQINKQLEDKGSTKPLIESTFKYIADTLVRNNGNIAKQVKELGVYLKQLNIKVDTKDLENWVKANTNMTANWGKNASPYGQVVDAYNHQQELLSGVSRDESNMTLKTAMDKYNTAVKEATEKYKEGTSEYNEAMSAAFNNLKSSLGTMVDELRNGSDWFSKWYQELEKKWGKGSSSYTGEDGGTGSGSKKKTPQDKFNDIVQDYIDDAKKVEEQYKNGILTQQQYAKALSDVELEALKTIAGVTDLDNMLKGLPESSKEAGKSLADMLKDFKQKAAENILLDYSQKRSEIQTTYDNSEKDAADLKKYNDALDDLAHSTKEELQKIEGLNEIVPLLSQAFIELLQAVNDTVAAMKDKEKQEQLDQLDKDTKIDVKEPKLKVILSPDDKSVNGMIQKIQRSLDEENFEINIQIENDETILDNVNDKIKDVDGNIKYLEEQLRKFNAGEDNDIDLVKDKAIERLHTLKNYMMELMNQASTMEDKLKLAKLLQELNKDIKELSSHTLDNISSMASAFDRLKDSVKDIAEAFDVEIEMEGLEKGITVINAVIQAIESVKEVMEVFDAFQELATKKKLAREGKEILSNSAVAASESAKSVAAMEAAIANGAEVASASAAAQANNKQATSNYNVAASEGAKAIGAGTAAVAQGAESVAKVPVVGAALAVAAAAAIAGALIAAFSKVKGFERGGFIPGTSYSGDKNLIRANSGELVLTRGDQRTLYRAIKTGDFGNGNGNVEFIIRGDQLVGVLANHNRIHR